jgi:hypothetical protein
LGFDILMDSRLRLREEALCQPGQMYHYQVYGFASSRDTDMGVNCVYPTLTQNALPRMLHAAPFAPVLPDGGLQQKMVEPLDLKEGRRGI